MNVSAHVDALEREGQLLAESAAATELSAAVPSCPEWNVEELVRHLGYVHRWARAHVAGEDTSMGEAGEAETRRFGPDKSELLTWFRQGVDDLAGALRSADPRLECWTFLPAPSPLAFWARRQAHETAIHRADVQLTRGAVSPFPPELAADGVDELLVGFAGRRPDRSGDPRSSFAVEATDTGDRWVVKVSDEGFGVERPGGPAACVLAGEASGLYLFLWNRQVAVAPASVQVEGDPSPLDAFRERVRVRWA